ncbi:hypothetical protein SNE40_011180 [Patella caerulea]|uniref:Laminin N-terminal domain-containing protein n=1 Tax=Patella caerulea TaxID=87958 RepID=A0AAN8JJH3_PATCE
MRVYSSCLFLLACAFLGFTYSQTLKPDETALFPVIFNLASHASIKANATCGENEPEVFCKLVEHVRIFPAENLHCDVCDLRGNNRKQMHPISNAINGRNTWWQSPSITNGRQLNFVTVDLDLGQVYQIAYIILKAANAPRPGNWILEKSIDGITYTPWQYFAISDGECREFYNVQPAIGVPKFTRDDQVICTSRYSRLDPLENGEIFVSLVNGRPGVEEPSQTLLDFTSARYIRIRLQKIRTLHADLMTFQNNKNLKDLDPTVTRRYFYSIKDISIGGQCICYGHARLCRPKDGNRTNLQCQCEHNTCGKNCEECCPGFNQKQWGRGKNGNGFQCEGN